MADAHEFTEALVGGRQAEAEGKRILQAISDKMAEAGYTAEDVGRLARFGMWQQGAKVKNEDGSEEIVTTDLYGFQLSPAWEDGPQWPVIERPAPIKLSPSKRSRPDRDYKTILVLPDPQIGFRRILSTGELIPMHDPRAMDVSIQMIPDVDPDEIINLGDTMDMSEWSNKFLQLPEFQFTTQQALEATHAFFARQRNQAREGVKIRKLRGNHDDRFEHAIITNAKAAMRLKKAGKPESWPVLSLANLLCFDELDVEMSGGYPAGKFKIADGARGKSPLIAIHGKKTDVVKQAKEARQSYVQGHMHHIAEHHVTYDLDGSPVRVVAWTPGCLCRVDGAVPSVHSAEDEDGRPIGVVENWQQGVGIVRVWPDGYWDHDVVEIHDGWAHYRDREYRSDLSVDHAAW